MRMLLLSIGIMLLLAGCGFGSSAPQPTGTPQQIVKPTTTTLTQRTIGINTGSNGRYAFVPATITIRAGTPLVWVNKTDVEHTVTFKIGGFPSRNVSPGKQVKLIIARAGSYTYYCKIHPYMQAAITVHQ